MAIVRAKPGETTEALIRRFKWAMEKDDILSELAEKKYYRKPSRIKQDNQRDLRNKLRQNNRKKKCYEI